MYCWCTVQIDDQNRVVHLGNFVIQLKSSTREVHLSATTEQERATWVNAIRSLQTDQDRSRHTASGSTAAALLRNMSESVLHASAIPVLMAHNRRFGRPNRFSKERKEERKRQRLPRMKKSFSELWIEDIIPQSGRHDASNIVEALCFAGIPKEARGRAWAWILGNKLQVNEDLFKICKARALAVRREMTLKREAETRSRLQAAERTTSATSLASSSSANSSSPATANNSNASEAQYPPVAEDKLQHLNGIDDAEKVQSGDEMQSMMLQEAVSIADMLVAHGERSIRLVNVDMPRTFGHHPLFQAGADGTERTTEVLEAYICYRPDLGYVQGMSYLAAALCFHMDSFTAFKAMVSLMSTSLLFDMFRLEEKRVSEICLHMLQATDSHRPNEWF